MSGFYLSYPQAFCPLWVFSQPLSPLYPITFLRLGIQSNFLFLIPKVFLCSGYSYCFYFLYTQRFFFPWVFLLLFASLYPKIFLSMGILTAFAFSIPKDFLFHGYSYCFFASLYPKLFFSLGIYPTFVSDIPKLLYSSEYNRCFSFHRTSFMSSITQPSFSM